VAKQIDSGALDVVDSALGIGGAGSAAITELDDGVVDQVLSVNELIRRGLAPPATQGIFRGVMRNTHSGAGGEFSTWTPYNPVLATILAPYPRPVPPGFDIWLLRACVVVTTVLGTVDAVLLIQNVRQGFGITQTGAFQLSNQRLPLAYWDTIVDQDVTAKFLVTGTENSDPWKQINQRLPRLGETGSVVQILFATESTATSAYECNLIFGMFPVGMGQDAVV